MAISQEIVQYLPELSASTVAATAAYGAGLIVDKVAGRIGDSKQDSVLAAQGVSKDEFLGRTTGVSAPTPTDSEPEAVPGSTLRNIMNHQAIPVSMAVAAGLTVATYFPERTDKGNESVLEVVVDRSFQTSQSGADKRSETISEEFNRTGKLKVRALVAKNGGSEPIKIEQISKESSYGPASLDEAMPTAFSEVYDASAPADSNSLGSKENRNAGILAVVDNNPLGKPNSIIKEAQRNGNLPIFIANVGEEQGQVAKDLKQISQKTGGQYWTAEKGTEKVAKEIADTIKPKEATPQGPQNEIPNGKFLSLASIALAAGLIKSRAALSWRGKGKRN